MTGAAVRRPPLWLIFSITATGIMANTLIIASIPDILEHFDRPDGDAGILVAVSPLPAIVLAPVGGLLADRFGRRAVLLPSLVLFGIGGLASGLAPTFELLLLFRFVQGIGSASMLGMSLIVIGDHWGGTDRGRLIGTNAAVLTTCLAIFPALGGLLNSVGGWRLAFAPYALALVTALLILRLLPAIELGPEVPLRDQVRAAGVGLRQPIVVLMLTLAFIVFCVLFALFLTAMPIHLEEEFGLGAGQRGLVFVAPAVVTAVVALRATSIREALGDRWVLLVGTALWSVSYLVIGLAGSIAVVIVASLGFAFSEGTVIPMVQDTVNSHTTADTRGAVISMLTAVTRLGQTTGPLIAKPLLDATSSTTIFLLGAALMAGLTVAQPLAWAVRRRVGGASGEGRGPVAAVGRGTA
jgi:MFS family permease